MEKQEAQLIRDILDGKQNKYRILVERYAPMVFHIVNGFVDREQDAEELSQEIFVKTYERLDSFSGQSKFSTWLYMIAKNHCRDYAKNIRRKNKSFSEMEEHDLERQMGYDASPDKDIERKEWVDLLKKGLDTITQDYAEAFLLKYESDMTYEAMSQRLGASVSALKVRVYRAKKELKEYMAKNN